MSSARFEAFLAKLYVDAATREEFAADPRGLAFRAGLDAAEIDAVARIDRVGLDLASRSTEHKRQAAGRRSVIGRLWAALRRRCSLLLR
jgi:hypothetical protein